MKGELIMGTIIVDCPICGRKLATIRDTQNWHATKVCQGCKVRIRYDYDKASKHLSAGPA